MWPFQFAVSMSKNVFPKASDKSVSCRWSVDVILVLLMTKNRAGFGDHKHTQKAKKQRKKICRQICIERSISSTNDWQVRKL